MAKITFNDSKGIITPSCSIKFENNPIYSLPYFNNPNILSRSSLELYCIMIFPFFSPASNFTFVPTTGNRVKVRVK